MDQDHQKGKPEWRDHRERKDQTDGRQRVMERDRQTDTEEERKKRGEESIY